MSNVKISWGLDIATRLMKYIDNVPRGKACQCICPGCDTPLVARQGLDKKWHFAHSVTVECNGETALHRAAKQILTQEANLNNEIQHPANQNCLCTTKDCLGIAYTNTVMTAEKEFFLMLGGQEEVKLCEDIQTDVFLTGEESQSLAVEICVTHKKNENDHFKYSLIKQDAIEIDLSMITWDANYEALRSAVLWTAPRSWVYSDSIEFLKEKSRNDLQSFILEKNNNYLKELSDFVFSVTNTEVLNKIVIQWPVISGYADNYTALNRQFEHHKEQRTVKIHTIDAHWQNIQNTSCWGCKAIVGGNISVDLYICLQNTNLKIDVITPIFLCIVGYESAGTELTILGCKWLNIDKWVDKLQALAENKLERKIVSVEQSQENARKFACEFLALTDNEKMSYLAKKLGIPLPKNFGKKSGHWNTREEIWKSLILLYRIQSPKSYKINLQLLAADKWLESMIGWSNAEESTKKRNIDLWFWFKELEKKGLVQHTGKQWFSIQSNGQE